MSFNKSRLVPRRAQVVPPQAHVPCGASQPVPECLSTLSYLSIDRKTLAKHCALHGENKRSKQREPPAAVSSPGVAARGARNCSQAPGSSPGQRQVRASGQRPSAAGSSRPMARRPRLGRGRAVWPPQAVRQTLPSGLGTGFSTQCGGPWRWVCWSRLR